MALHLLDHDFFNLIHIDYLYMLSFIIYFIEGYPRIIYKFTPIKIDFFFLFQYANYIFFLCIYIISYCIINGINFIIIYNFYISIKKLITGFIKSMSYFISRCAFIILYLSIFLYFQFLGEINIPGKDLPIHVSD